MSKIVDYAEEYIRLRTALEEAKAIETEAQKAFDELRKHRFVELMEDVGLESMRVKGVGTVSIATDAYTSIKAENKDAAYKWLEDNGFGDIIKNNVNSSTMKALLKDLSRKGIEFPENIFSFTPYSYVKITK